MLELPGSRWVGIMSISTQRNSMISVNYDSPDLWSRWDPAAQRHRVLALGEELGRDVIVQRWFEAEDADPAVVGDPLQQHLRGPVQPQQGSAQIPQCWEKVTVPAWFLSFLLQGSFWFIDLLNRLLVKKNKEIAEFEHESIRNQHELILNFLKS